MEFEVLVRGAFGTQVKKGNDFVELIKDILNSGIAEFIYMKNDFGELVMQYHKGEWKIGGSTLFVSTVKSILKGDKTL